MGLCFSKKERRNKEKSSPKDGEKPTLPAQAPPPAVVLAAAVEEPVTDKKPVLVVVHRPKAAGIDAGGEDKKENGRVESVVAKTVVPVRTSSCSKEEVDAILIQCGRLSRSSSGTVISGDNGGAGRAEHRRRYSGSKRSYDFDNEKGGAAEEEPWERTAAASRPSPNRRTPGRERSGSRERSSGGGGGSRRVSRSPGRRSDGPARQLQLQQSQPQPAKMVSVPAREKQACAEASGGRGARSALSAPLSGKRSASPRSNSPARGAAAASENPTSHTHGPSLSRSSSRKAEQSPCRRNPMAEIDENSARPNSKSQKAAVAEVVPTVPQARGAAASKGAAPESLAARSATGSRSSRRTSSRDFDAAAATQVNGTSYASLLLEDIQNYHHQATVAAITLPACVTKACSIIEAVADLNSSSSEGRQTAAAVEWAPVVVESEIAVDDDLTEPSLHKYVSLREVHHGSEAEPEESAGSNSFVCGNQWSCGSWEPKSVESTGRCQSATPPVAGEPATERRVSPARRPAKAAYESGGARRGSGAQVSASGDRGSGIGKGGGRATMMASAGY